MIPVLLLPGYGDSGPAHWQSAWARAEPSFLRATLPRWDAPELEAWLVALDAEVRRCARPPVIAAHSLGCLLVAHHVARGGRLGGALLVAPPDPAAPTFPSAIVGFAEVPRVALARTILAASEDDPYASLAFSRRCAADWGSELVELGPLGHVNADSGLGDWPVGRALLDRLR